MIDKGKRGLTVRIRDVNMGTRPGKAVRQAARMLALAAVLAVRHV